MAANALKGRRVAANIVFVGFCWIAAIIALTALTAILWSLVTQGFGGLNLDVFLKATPAEGSTGGLANAIIGSLVMCGLGMAIAIIVGVMAGTWLAEYGRDHPYAELIRFLNDILLSAPSVLVGLFIWVLLVHPFGGFSALAGAVSLAVIATPVVTRTTEDVLKLQPTALRESGVALGAPQWTTIQSILWKSAGSGILTAILLAFARISGETAPLLFTSLNNQFFTNNLFGPIASLPTAIYKFALSGDDALISLAWTGALIVAAAVLTINIVARILAREPRRQ